MRPNRNGVSCAIAFPNGVATHDSGVSQTRLGNEGMTSLIINHLQNRFMESRDSITATVVAGMECIVAMNLRRWSSRRSGAWRVATLWRIETTGAGFRYAAANDRGAYSTTAPDVPVRC